MLYLLNAVIITFAVSRSSLAYSARVLFYHVSALLTVDYIIMLGFTKVFIWKKQMQNNETNLRKILNTLTEGVFTLEESEKDSSSNTGVFTKHVPADDLHNEIESQGTASFRLSFASSRMLYLKEIRINLPRTKTEDVAGNSPESSKQERRPVMSSSFSPGRPPPPPATLFADR